MGGMPDNAHLGIKNHKLRLEGTELRTIFEPVLDETIKLVMDQINRCGKPVKAVILVGGFGQNGYLRDEIAKEVKRFSNSIEVIQSVNWYVCTPEIQR